MAFIDGWAYNKNEKELAEENRESEFNSVVVKNIQDWVVVESVKSGYAHKEYRGYLKEGHPEITLKELLIYLDRGNLCFGGRGSIGANGHFSAIVHTD